MQREQLLSSNVILRSTFLMLYLKEDNMEAFFTYVTRNRTPYLWAHIPERLLSKGDCVESGYQSFCS